MGDWAELDAWKKRLDTMHMRDKIPRKVWEGEIYHWQPIRSMNEDEKPMTTPNYYRPGDPLGKLVPFLCPTCGGVNDARQYTLLRVAYGPTLLMPCKKCECAPESAQKKHDGKLGDDEHVYYHNYPTSTMVRVEAEIGEITPGQALSLLEWLLQEREELARLAKEQGE